MNCDSTPTQSQGPRSTRCGLNHFIFREGAQVSLASAHACPPAPAPSHAPSPGHLPLVLPLPQVTFVVTFDVNPKAQLGDRLLLTANMSR